MYYDEDCNTNETQTIEKSSLPIPASFSTEDYATVAAMDEGTDEVKTDHSSRKIVHELDDESNMDDTDAANATVDLDMAQEHGVKDSQVTEFDHVMDDAAQMIGEAETYLDEMRMIQVKNAILMDSLVMIGA